MRRVNLVRAVIITLICASHPAASTLAAVQRTGTSAPQSEAAKVDLNTADKEALQALPGVGVRTAELIIEYRNASGGFKAIEELMNIRGIGERTFLRLRPLIRVSLPGSSRE